MHCGPTASGIKSIAGCLASAPGGGKWDIGHFNFDIHDRNTPVAEYVSRLEQLVDRMKQTGATLVWAITTPIPDEPEKKQTASSIVERNEAAAKVMQKHGVGVDYLDTFIEPRLAEVQPPKDVHFMAEGYDMLGSQVAAAIFESLERKYGCCTMRLSGQLPKPFLTPRVSAPLMLLSAEA